MKNKLIILLMTITNIITPAFAKNAEVSGEVKTFASYFVKFSLGVIISAVIIAVGLWIFSLFKKRQEAVSSDSKADEFTCEIDDTKTISEAIKTFLTINE